MSIKAKNFTKGGFADAGLLFAAGLFFLTLALTVVYFSYFGLAPLPKSNAVAEMSAAASMSFPGPAAVAVLNENENKEFLNSLPQIRVKEIFIGSYGAADKEILGKLRNKIEKTYGVKTTLLNPGPAIPKEEPFYSKDGNRYNSDVLQKSVEGLSSVYGQAARFLYVVDLNMSSFSDENPPQAEWLRAEKGQNAGLISLYSFRADGQQTLLKRAEKVALRALGITVGLESSPSTKDESCIMYPALTLEELDAQGNALCDPEAQAAERIFQK